MRQKLVESGAVDVMIDIRSNFFYTRPVPCQLWFFDRAKERDEARRDHVLMLDARNIYRKVSRAIFDFSPEQQKNIAAIVWLYRGQPDRFLKIGRELSRPAPLSEGQATAGPLSAFDKALGELIESGWTLCTTEARDPDPTSRDLEGINLFKGLRCRPTFRAVRRSEVAWQRSVAWELGKTRTATTREQCFAECGARRPA